MKLTGLDTTSRRTFTGKQKLALFFIPRLISVSLKTLALTINKDIESTPFVKEIQAGRANAIFTAWHEFALLASIMWKNSGCVSLVSHSFDGEIAARTMLRCGIHPVRGSSSLGGLKGLGDLNKALEMGAYVGLIADGPRGPRRVAKPGTAMLAAQTKLPILPVAFSVNASWRLNSWDRLVIPKPFGKIVCRFGEAISPPESVTGDAIMAKRDVLEERLNALQEDLENEKA